MSGPSAPTNVLVVYTMQGQLLTNSGPNAWQWVYWDVQNTPDYTGAQSGYFGQLQNIAISATQNISSPTNGAVTPTSAASGDLSGVYPNPTVSGINNLPIVGTPVAGDVLQVNSGATGMAYVPESSFTNPTEITEGPAGSRPAATGSGSLYLCTDAPVMYLDVLAGTWRQFATEYLPSGPAASSYTLVPASGAGSLALLQQADSIRFATLWATTGQAFALTQANIGSPGYPANLNSATAWAVTLEFTFLPAIDGQYPEIAVCASNGVGSGSVVWGAFFAGSNTANVPGYAEWTLPSTRSAVTPLSGGWSTLLSGTGRGHLRLVNDGTVLHFQAGVDGKLWEDMYSIASPQNFTYWGFYATSGTGATGYSQGFIHSNTLSSPQQYTASGATNSSPSVITIGAHTLLPGDIVALHGFLGNTGVNTSPTGGNYTFGGAAVVTAVTGTTITTNLNGNGAWTSGGVVTLLSR